ncbi:Pre-mRNA-splicing factor cwc26 [Neolecta irregularis DAH-3]|uniref:Pre-mRNA-splicing factor cwc26 n=1 Tax=Neolecta irregularis (strain DAH-3) TaxID=1198029 RepID=A0A1U7LWP9_NEOID|nr:Pre-mRNA-splicing factor cwc26 [Neolecta irregularis DAH-3]|eukprot:OLL27097.1 Pre-mRNA-splicing factor cwc26 [Neolecta irregularis DAH-3]
MSLADYLAKNYLTKDDPKKKKRRKKEEESALRIDDNEAMGWEVVHSGGQDDVEDAVVLENALDSANPKSFAAAERSNWETVQESQKIADDEQPEIVGQDTDELRTVMGLHTAEQVSRNLAQQQDEDRRRYMKEDPTMNGRGAETIYRDATGRRVDVALQRAEARKKLEAEEARKKKEKELGMGVVQQREKEERRKQLQEIKAVPFARTVDDIVMNEELKSRERWNDPAASFLSTKGKTKDGKANTESTFKGASMPNRFGVLPGYRWDGVDRSNGFEKQYFTKQNEVKLREEAAYGWSTEDM